MRLIEFTEIPVPEIFQDMYHKEKIYIIRYKMKLNRKPFDHGETFIRKEDVLKFCERNNITIEELKKVWKKS